MNVNYNWFLVNTFSDNTFSGNPTPVYLLEQFIPRSKMEILAKESPFAVSVFIRIHQKVNEYVIKYFTSTGQIPACGHGTLAAAFALFHMNKKRNKLLFITLDNSKLQATTENDLTFVQYPRYKKQDIKPNQEINIALGINKFRDYFICKELETLFIELENEMQVIAVKPDFDNLIQSSNTLKEVVVMSKSNDKVNDYFLRSFCPWIGISEDPVTGSVHSVLGPYWQGKLNKTNLNAKQLSKRGGKISIIVSKEYVRIGGECLLIEKNTLDI